MQNPTPHRRARTRPTPRPPTRPAALRPGSHPERGAIGTVVIALVVVLAAAGFAGYWFLVKSDAKPKPKIVPTKTVTGNSIDGTWTVGSDGTNSSFVQYRIQEQFVSDLIDVTATGRTNDVTGTMTINGTDVSDIDITANLATLKSDREFRDNAIKGRGLETDKFPEATFTSTGTVSLAATPKTGETVTVPVTGNLTLHGVTREITIPLEGRWDGTAIQVVGETPIVLADYGITAPTGGPVAKVADTGNLELQLFFTKSG